MKKLSYLLLILIFASCNKNLKESKKDGITIYFTDNIPEIRHRIIADLISNQVKESTFENLKKIKNIKVDSVPFSIILYIPFTDSITRQETVELKSFAKLLTDFSFHGVPINIILTDEKFKAKENILYDKNAVTYTGTAMVKGRVKIHSTPNAETFSPEILDEILRNKMPELYKGSDSVLISVDMIRDTVKIDFNIDRELHNVDTLKDQFIKTDKLFFAFTFNKRPVLFHVRNKKNKELITVFAMTAQ
jgi:hypothetical protein